MNSIGGIAYSADNAALIKRGDKTQTRRLSTHWLRYEVGAYMYRKVGRFTRIRNARLWTRLTTKPRRERLQDISPADLLREGAPIRVPGRTAMDRYLARLMWFRRLWDSLHPESFEQWAANPKVSVLTFKHCRRPAVGA